MLNADPLRGYAFALPMDDIDRRIVALLRQDARRPFQGVHVRARETSHLEEALERIRDHRGVTRTQTQIVLSTLFERPFDERPE